MANVNLNGVWTRSRVLALETWKYFLVSLAALAIDYSLLVTLTTFAHIHYLVSAAVGLSAGFLTSYGLSVTFVFSERRLRDRRLEFLAFLALALVGVALNEFLMKIFVEGFGLGYAIAKVPATAVGFVFNFGLRRSALFTSARLTSVQATPPMTAGRREIEEAAL
jgi:putative flippase GtrA